VTTRNENTIAFDLWPNMIVVEGPAQSIGMLIGMLYDDARVQRDMWAVSHNEASRKDYAAKLKHGGAAPKRQGIGARDKATADFIQARAKALGLSSFLFSKQTKTT
jgi:hypothetical protein